MSQRETLATKNYYHLTMIEEFMRFIIASICVGFLLGHSLGDYDTEKISAGLWYAAFFGLCACLIDRFFFELAQHQNSVDSSDSDEKK